MVILIAGAMSSTGLQVVKNLLEQNYQVRALVENVSQARQIWGDQVDLFQADIANPVNFSPEIMAEVSSIIYCSDIQVQVQRSPATSDTQSRNTQNSLEAKLGIKLNFPQTIDREKLATYESIKNLDQAIVQSSWAGSKMLFDFTQPNLELQETWGAVNDNVMGGVSQSNIMLTTNRAVFSGIVSTENNGGFASVRTRNFMPPLDLADYDGIELRVIGDGKRYKFIARCEGEWDGVGYSYSFDTIYNFPTVVRVPWQDLIPVFRAKTVREAGQIDASKIYSMQLMLSKFEYDGELNPKFEAGSFQLQVEYLQAYSQKQLEFIQLDSTEVNYRRNLTTVLNKGISTVNQASSGDILVWQLVS